MSPASTDPRVEDADGAQDELARLAARIAARVRPVCPDWRDADFDALVLAIARTKLRWAEEERRAAVRAVGQ